MWGQQIKKKGNDLKMKRTLDTNTEPLYVREKGTWYMLFSDGHREVAKSWNQK